MRLFRVARPARCRNAREPPASLPLPVDFTLFITISRRKSDGVNPFVSIRSSFSLSQMDRRFRPQTPPQPATALSRASRAQCLPPKLAGRLLPQEGGLRYSAPVIAGFGAELLRLDSCYPGTLPSEPEMPPLRPHHSGGPHVGLSAGWAALTRVSLPGALPSRGSVTLQPSGPVLHAPYPGINPT